MKITRGPLQVIDDKVVASAGFDVNHVKVTMYDTLGRAIEGVEVTRTEHAVAIGAKTAEPVVSIGIEWWER